MKDLTELTKTGAWRLEDDGDGVAFLVFDLPDTKVNILSGDVLRDLDAVLRELESDKDLRALIVVGGKPESGTFIAGADVREIRGVQNASQGAELASMGQAVLGRFASLHAVTIAAIDGNCLGGGTELALACDMRIAADSPKTKIGLPEVQLGILPGFGGSQRLPRLVGIIQSLPVILTGKPLDVRRAAKIGLVDKVVYPGLLRKEAAKLAKEALRKGGKSFHPRRPGRPLLQRALEALPPGRAFLRSRARKGVLRRAGPHYPAPLLAIDAIFDGYGKTIEEGLKVEAELVGRLVASDVSKSLIDLFLSSEAARRGSAREATGSSCVPQGRIGLLGAGVMGGGLAALIARKGYRVRMKDISHEAVQTGLRKVWDLYSGRVKRRRMSESERDGCLGSISGTLDFSGFSEADLTVEAIVEDLEIKKKVLAEAERAIGDDAVLASNTSSLSITEMGAALERPERFVGLHFFNPVDRMPLVEVVRGEKSGDRAVEVAESFARALGKVPVRVGDGPGFLVNRLLGPYLNEAVRLFEEGNDPVAIDKTIRDFGMPMGPFELLDEVGLDVAAKVCRTLFDAFGERARPSLMLDRIADLEGVLGKKSGKGFYVHSKRGKKPNREVLKLGKPEGGDWLLAAPEMWIRRLIHPIVNEAAFALDEGIVETPSLCDLAMVMGTGFAPFRGGPLRYADAVGTPAIVQSLEGFKEPRLAPAPLLARLAEEKRGFYSLESETPSEPAASTKEESPQDEVEAPRG